MRRRCLAVAVFLLPTVVAAEGITIDHKGVGCVTVGKFPEFVAHLSPVEEVSRARIDFHAEGDTHWYYVEMKQKAGVFSGVLPKPLKEAKAIHYYVEAMDRNMAASRTEEYSPIVAGAGECSKKGAVAGTLAVTSVVVGAPGGAPLVPLGFSAVGVVNAAGAAGATAASGAAAGSGGAGGGIGTTAIAVGVGAAAAVAGIVAVATHKGGGGSIDVTPSVALVEDGGSVQFTAVAKDKSGNPISPQPSFSWSVLSGAALTCARVTQSGLATLSSAFCGLATFSPGGAGTCATIQASAGPGNTAVSALGWKGSNYPCPGNP
jgi:hypothetical protein